GDASAFHAVIEVATGGGQGCQPWVAGVEALLQAVAGGVGEVAAIAGPDAAELTEFGRGAAHAGSGGVVVPPGVERGHSVLDDAGAHAGMGGVGDVAEEVDAGGERA